MTNKSDTDIHVGHKTTIFTAPSKPIIGHEDGGYQAVVLHGAKSKPLTGYCKGQLKRFRSQFLDKLEFWLSYKKDSYKLLISSAKFCFQVVRDHESKRVARMSVSVLSEYSADQLPAAIQECASLHFKRMG